MSVSARLLKTKNDDHLSVAYNVLVEERYAARASPIRADLYLLFETKEEEAEGWRESWQRGWTEPKKEEGSEQERQLFLLEAPHLGQKIPEIIFL